MKKTNFCKIALFGFFAVIFVSCATPKVEYADTNEEMFVAAFQEGKLESRHYSAQEMKQWNVLVLNTKNTERTLEMLKNLYSTDKSDKDTQRFVNYQNDKLKESFKTVSFAGNAGEVYDAVLLRDCQITLGVKSASFTKINLSYQFVYPASEDMEIGEDFNFINRGIVSCEGIGVIPYPAYNYASQAGNQRAADGLRVNFSAGVDLLSFPGEERKFAATEENLAAFTKERTQEIAVNVDANASVSSANVSPSSSNSSSKSQSSSSESAGKSANFTSGKFKDLLKK